MKSNEIASIYEIDKKEFEQFVRDNKLAFSEGFINLIIDDSNVEQYVSSFKEYKEQRRQKLAEEARIRAEEEDRKKKAMAEMLITSGFSFDGYTITKYSGYISGDDAIQINRDELGGNSLCNALVQIRRQALYELKEAAYNLGCNAIIGVDFDYMTFDPETIGVGGTHYYCPYLVCVTANGNAAIIEKNTEKKGDEKTQE